MKKLIVSVFLLILATSGLSAFTSSQMDRVERSVTVTGSSFDEDITFSSIYYLGEWFDVYAVDNVSGGIYNWFSMMVVEDRATGHYWYGSFHENTYTSGAISYTDPLSNPENPTTTVTGETYSTARTFVILFEVTVDGDNWTRVN